MSKEKMSKTEPTPKVYHCKRDQLPSGCIYVGRPTCWGNPFVIGSDGTREEVIQKFRDSLSKEDHIEIRRTLWGRSLTCWCAPKACHADVLLEIANKDD